MAAMNTFQISQILQSDSACSKIYGGTWPIDKIPARTQRPICYVINTSPSWHSGTHWIAVFLNNKEHEFFCSLGTQPPKEVKRIMKRKNRLTKSKKRMQGLSSELCGQYCILYIMCRCRGYNLNNFLKCFSDCTKVNDNIVSNFF